ncbi:MAG: MmgE/PrpD family protein [Chloroflexi bacterium]|nr:MmgE/PrpD family protein [Chloroflexota bacterium]
MAEPLPSRALARFLTTAAVPAHVRSITRRYLLDWLSSALAGGELHPPRIARSVVDSLGGEPQATVLATGTRTSAPLAAFANAAASHVLEMDDLDRDSISHPAAPIVSAALAVAERDGTPPEALLDAIAVGYEVGIRVGEALGPSHYEHWHTTGTAGTLGAAAAAARLARLDEGAALSALGTAGTMAAGLWEFLADGAMSKQLHPAKAAHDGILASILAAAGFSAASRILEGPKGLLAAMSDAPRPDRLTDGLDARMPRWRIEGVSFKVHASCRHTHSAVDAALALRRAGLRPETIARVDVRLYRQALGLLAGVEPHSPYAAKFSLPFCVASALIHGDLAPQRFTDDTIADRETLALTERVSFTTDPELDVLYPRAWPSVVTVTTTAGNTVTERVDHPAGDPESGIGDAEIAAKFVTLTEPILGPRALETVERVLRRDPPPSARELASLVVPTSTEDAGLARTR